MTPTSASDPASLTNLHDIVVPPPVAWWPPAPGWYWLAGAVTLLAAWLALRALRRHRADAYRRAALRELGTLNAPATGADLAALPALLKRAATAAYARETVAGLSGPRWWAFLDATSGTRVFTDGAGPLLDRVAYDPAATLDDRERRALVVAAEGWLRTHRRDSARAPC